MPIEAHLVSKVIINGEWFSVELGTFEVTELLVTDEEGEPLHDPIDALAYTFMTPNRDRYWGPLSAIELMKMAER
jgi:hypothetical protein